MSPIELFRARLVWLNTLDFENAELLDWRGWAEKIILTIDFVAPFWLCELTAAVDAKAALQCVCDGVEIEAANSQITVLMRYP